MSGTPQPGPRDRLARPLTSLRISVTDRCNLRCGYCMPERDYTWLPREDLLTFEEIATLAAAFARLGVRRVRLTGGEPTLRRDLTALVGLLAEQDGLQEVTLTTNALTLSELARPLARAGLTRVTVSLDTLRPDRFRELTRHDGLERCLAGIAAAARAGLAPVKINTVVMRGVNDDELGELLAFARDGGHELRLIEYMDVGGATRWEAGQVVPQGEILERLGNAFGTPVPQAGRGSAPAERYRLPDGTVFGVIPSVSAPFCGACDRARLTADGRFFTCLYAREGLDLRASLRGGATADALAALVSGRWARRDDRGAEERLALERRAPLAEAADLKRDPHLEMHTRGG